jgi:hypothetical protein
MQKLLNQNAFTEIKFQGESGNYLNRMRLPRIKSVANENLLKQNAFTENKF